MIDRNIYLFEDINESSALEIVSRINYINEIDDMEEQALISEIDSLVGEGLLKEGSLRGLPAREPISIEVNSHGGSSPAGFSIITAIQNSETPIIGYVTGNCMSMAIPIIASCDFRIASEFSKFMIHDVYSASEGKFNDLNSSLDYVSSVREDYIRVTSKYTNLTSDEVKEITDRNSDFFFSPEEALEMGLVDSIDNQDIDEDLYFDRLYGANEIEGENVESAPEEDGEDVESIAFRKNIEEESKKVVSELVDTIVEGREKASEGPVLGEITDEELVSQEKSIMTYPESRRSEITIDSSDVKGYSLYIDEEGNVITSNSKNKTDGLFSRIAKALGYVMKG